jgi:hypothetical protein
MTINNISETASISNIDKINGKFLLPSLVVLDITAGGKWEICSNFYTFAP